MKKLPRSTLLTTDIAFFTHRKRKVLINIMFIDGNKGDTGKSLKRLQNKMIKAMAVCDRRSNARSRNRSKK